jgi:hypothetical protein
MIFKLLNEIHPLNECTVSLGSTVVELSPHHHKVVGLIPGLVFLYPTFLSHFFHNAKISNYFTNKEFFNEHGLINYFHFKHEARIKEKLLN